MTVTGLTLAGADASNYLLFNPTETATADVTALTVTGSVTASNRFYDTTNVASISARNLPGVLGGDVVDGWRNCDVRYQERWVR